MLNGRTLTGAWIETSKACGLTLTCPVAPSRARGLKRDTTVASLPYNAGRALTGAWIETAIIQRTTCQRPSRALTGAWIETRSKYSKTLPQLSNRRALTGAWIETRCWSFCSKDSSGRALTGAWIETLFQLRRRESTLRVAPSRARGLKLFCNHLGPIAGSSRPHGRVD